MYTATFINGILVGLLKLVLVQYTIKYESYALLVIVAAFAVLLNKMSSILAALPKTLVHSVVTRHQKEVLHSCKLI